jgi:hypothetical protein
MHYKSAKIMTDLLLMVHIFQSNTATKKENGLSKITPVEGYIFLVAKLFKKVVWYSVFYKKIIKIYHLSGDKLICQ